MPVITASTLQRPRIYCANTSPSTTRYLKTRKAPLFPTPLTDLPCHTAVQRSRMSNQSLPGPSPWKWRCPGSPRWNRIRVNTATTWLPPRATCADTASPSTRVRCITVISVHMPPPRRGILNDTRSLNTKAGHYIYLFPESFLSTPLFDKGDIWNDLVHFLYHRTLSSCFLYFSSSFSLC